jgi:hypothetical protein
MASRIRPLARRRDNGLRCRSGGQIDIESLRAVINAFGSFGALLRTPIRQVV